MSFFNLKKLINRLLWFWTIAFCFFYPHTAYSELKQDIIRYINDSNLIRYDATELVSFLFNDLSKKLGQIYCFSVNKRSTNNKCIEVYVLDGKGLDQLNDFSPHPARFVRLAAKNCVSLQPNVILLDSSLLGLILQSSKNGNLARADYRHQLKNYPESESTEQYGAFGIIATSYLSYGNIDYVLHDRNENTLNIQSKMFKPIYEGDLAILFERQSLALSPIILHELGHLSTGSEGQFLQFLGNYQEQLVKKRKAEELADEFAARLMKTIIRGNLSHLDEIAQIRDTIDLFQQIFLKQLFDGFRGLAARDYFMELIHKEGCNRKNERPPGWFLKPENLRSGNRGIFPLITEEEFKGVKKKIQELKNKSYHPPLMFRSELFLKAILSGLETKNEDIRKLNESKWKELQFYHALIDQGYKDFIDSYKFLYFSQIGETKPLVVPAKFLQQAFSVFGVSKPAINCPEDNCYILNLKEGGYLEYMERGGHITMANLVIPTGDFQSIDGRKKENQFFQTIGRMFFVVGAIEGYEAVPDRVSELVNKIRSELMSCGYVSRVFYNEDYFLCLRTMNSDGWISMKLTGR